MNAPAATPAPRPVTVRDRIGFLAMIFGMFMSILDIQIVSSSLAEIQAGLSAGADEISWVQTSYLIAEVIMIPLSGYLARMLSTRIMFTVSALGFTAMSVACGFAWSIESMIVLRAAQGFLGGALIPSVFATSYVMFPQDRRATVGVVIGLVATLAPTLGPTLGGFLTQSFSWHWLFLINIVPGLLVSVTVWLCIDVDRPNRALLRIIDLPGLLLMALFLGSLEFVVEEGARNDWLEDEWIATFAVVAAAAGIGFFWRVLSCKNPIVELRAFANRNFALGCLFSFTIGVGLYGSVYLLPLFLGRVRGMNSLDIGQVMIVTGAFQFVSAPLAGMLSKRLDLRVMLALGLSLFGLGILVNGRVLSYDADFWELFLPQALRGLSLMLCFLPVNTLALGTLPPDQLKNASGLYNLMRNLGGAIGLATINTVLIDRFALHQSRLADNLTLARPAVGQWLEGLTAKFTDSISGDPELAALKVIARLVQREALVLTLSDCMMLMAGTFGFALLFLPLLRRPRPPGSGR
jgi:DHA2 family multidrug resistance protein